MILPPKWGWMWITLPSAGEPLSRSSKDSSSKRSSSGWLVIVKTSKICRAWWQRPFWRTKVSSSLSSWSRRLCTKINSSSTKWKFQLLYVSRVIVAAVAGEPNGMNHTTAASKEEECRRRPERSNEKTSPTRLRIFIQLSWRKGIEHDCKKE